MNNSKFLGGKLIIHSNAFIYHDLCGKEALNLMAACSLIEVL